ncbi:hypothetical protein ACFQ6B_23725 [Streptomyces wedmorensis]|uniref:Uncharacterized protein n=1 Tax=Streptomyces wedmorensis TaxID=43759 RepID=A0ABW6J6H7_STRWE
MATSPEPTVAELRAHLAAQQTSATRFQADLIGSVIDFVDDYLAERAAETETATQDPTAAGRDQEDPTPNGLVRWAAYWTLERQENGTWHRVTAQSRPSTNDRPDILARYLLGREQRHQAAGATLRVRVWRDGATDSAPLAEATTSDQ